MTDLVKRLDTPTEFKLANALGGFEGYAAIFGNVDQGGDVIVQGAFREFVKTRDGKVLILYQHSVRDPIGKAIVSQDTRGLHVRGELALEDPTASKAYGLMKSGILDAMSIGYQVLPGGAEQDKSVRKLTGLKLYEVSLVTWGLNEQARVETVKSALDCQHPRELEHLLRDALQLSSRKAKAASNALWPILNTERDVQEGDRDDRAIAAYVSQLNSITTFLKGLK